MTTKSANPAYPDAPPTSPGGMSRKALIKELEDKHNYEGDWTSVKWPTLIDMVIEERQAREAEQPEKIMADIMDNSPEFAEATAKMLAVETVEEAVLAANDMFDLLDEDADLIEQATLRTERDVPAPDDLIIASYGVDEEPEHHMGEYDEGVLDPETLFAEMAAAYDEATPPPIFIGVPGVRDYVFDNHAGAGPSGAERWMNCTMSLTASRAFLETLSPNQQREFAKSSTAARQGTTAHSVAEVEANLILGRVTQDEVDYTLIELSVTPEDEGEAYDDEMAEYVTEYTDLVKSYAQERGNDHILIESRVEADIPLTGMHEGEVYVIRGSADLIALPVKTGAPESKSLVVGDLKYGEGLDVDVDENPQIRLYALGVLALLADPETGELPVWIEDVVYHIIQPRLGGIKTWTETIDELLEWRDEVLAPALTQALYGSAEGATYSPSELACQWCPARGGCPALTEQRVEQAAGLFDVIVESEFENGPGTFPETTTLSAERLGELLTMVAGLTDIYKDLKEEAQRRLHRGSTVPGYQLVNYTPPRKWVETAQDKIAAGLDNVDTDLLFRPATLITPTQAEKILGDEVYPLIEALVIKPDKRPVIAKEGDRRKTWEGKPPEAMFAALTEEEA